MICRSWYKEANDNIIDTGKLEALSEFSIENVTSRTLRDDMAKTIDRAAAAKFLGASYKYVPVTTASYNLATNGTFTGTQTSGLTTYHVKNIIDILRKRNVPKVDGENYVCIASVDALRYLKDDSAFTTAAAYGDPDRLFSGEVGRYYSCRFVEETNALATYTSGAGTAYGEAVFFGADCVMEGVALPEEIRAKIPTDYGRSKGVAWYSLLGFQRIWNYADDAEEHIIHVGSLNNA